MEDEKACRRDFTCPPWVLGGITAAGIPPPESWNWWSWLLGVASTGALFFIAWGLKDVKGRYDKVPLLEAKNTELEGKIRRLCTELGKRYEDC